MLFLIAVPDFCAISTISLESSTVSLTIIEELSENAREAVENVQDSMNAVKHQNELIGSATVEFEGVGDNIGVLTTNISTVDSKIGGLADANDTICSFGYSLAKSSRLLISIIPLLLIPSLYIYLLNTSARLLICIKI